MATGQSCRYAKGEKQKGLVHGVFRFVAGGRCAQIKSVGFEPYLLSRYRQTPCNQISKAHVSPRERYRFTLGCYENWRFWIARRKANASLCSMYVRSSCKQTVSWSLNFAYLLRSESDRERIPGMRGFSIRSVTLFRGEYAFAGRCCYAICCWS